MKFLGCHYYKYMINDRSTKAGGAYEVIVKKLIDEVKWKYILKVILLYVVMYNQRRKHNEYRSDIF